MPRAEIKYIFHTETTFFKYVQSFERRHRYPCLHSSSKYVTAHFSREVDWLSGYRFVDKAKTMLTLRPVCGVDTVVDLRLFLRTHGVNEQDIICLKCFWFSQRKKVSTRFSKVTSQVSVTVCVRVGVGFFFVFAAVNWPISEISSWLWSVKDCRTGRTSMSLRPKSSLEGESCVSWA